MASVIEDVVAQDNTAEVEESVEKAKRVLMEGDYLLARRLAQEGQVRFPDNTRLQQLARLLAPPRVHPPSSRPVDSLHQEAVRQTAAANRDWMRRHRAEYLGQWVALRDGQLLGAASSIAELQELAGDLSRALVAKIF